ncbi:uncharacterized protein THITE_2112942 [Thermothielavioides terrestris NRRL 8126]|uniref:Uncharacterized protein n=1 Tax=Thermothielavioides terrestris (strain ATCC 38088 / NRRL 8126) TaxID=578455 RepID=G2R1F9_THETT|nr:uncharacterized protein THITE_2112942 [Thermothielavioides terrestris NRRL 8126]AEO65698.1 hypothetical protein THITE_2112942 [Thermothielavioides terrestris NRRL 8126]
MSIWRNLHSPPSDDENNFLPEKDEYCMCIVCPPPAQQQARPVHPRARQVLRRMP